MAQGDYNIQNQSFPSFRSDLNSTLSAINSSNSGTSRPSSAVEGTIWLDTTSASTPTLKFYDGSDDISLATIDYSANTVNWLDSTVVADLVNDTTPQLGGNLDVNGNSIVSVSNGNITFTPDGTGKVIIDGLSYPTADGTANQVLTTNGSGVLSFADASGGGTSWQSSVKTANFTATAGEGYFVNTSGGAFEIDLPTSPSVGDEIEFVDFSRSFGTNNLTLDQGSNKFQGFTSPKPVYDVDGQGIRIVYSGSTQGWIPIRDDDVTNEVPQTVTADFLCIAGGGAGGKSNSGGGGAGGYRNSYSTESSGGGASSESSLSLTQGAVYTVTIGAGGTAVTSSSSNGGDGNNSSISGTGVSITSIGGGGGNSDGSGGNTGNSGGSGGGSASGQPGGSGTANQGFDGGSGYSGANSSGGGGGGASEVGATGVQSGGGNGGNGLSSSINASATTRAGGGGGTTEDGTGSTGSGGSGGAGGGSYGGTPGSGTTNTGSGGGGTHSGSSSGAGGSGVVILRLATADYTGTTSGSPTVTTSGSDTIITFNASGSYTA